MITVSFPPDSQNWNIQALTRHPRTPLFTEPTLKAPAIPLLSWNSQPAARHPSTHVLVVSQTLSFSTLSFVNSFCIYLSISSFMFYSCLCDMPPFIKYLLSTYYVLNLLILSPIPVVQTSELPGFACSKYRAAQPTAATTQEPPSWNRCPCSYVHSGSRGTGFRELAPSCFHHRGPHQPSEDANKGLRTTVHRNEIPNSIVVLLLREH